MRTTVDIPDVLYRRLKSHAAKEGVSVKAILLRSAQTALAPAPNSRRGTISLPLIRDPGPKVKLTNADIEKLLSA